VLPLLCAIVATATVAGIGSTSTAARSPKPACATAGKSYVKTAAVRIYVVPGQRYPSLEPDDPDDPESPDHATTAVEDAYYACWLASGSRLRLDARCRAKDAKSNRTFWKCLDRPGFYSDPAIGGRYVAFLAQTSDRERNNREIVVAKLGRTPTRRTAYRFTGFQPDRERIVVSPSGAVAFGYGTLDEFLARADSFIVYVAPLKPGRQPTSEVLDSGTHIKPRSLRQDLRKKQITWVNGKDTKSAPFR